MAEIIDNEKLPWPSRLVDFSYNSLAWGFVIFIAGMLIGLIGDTWGLKICEIIGYSGILIFAFSFVISFMLSFVALFGMPFYGFKKCGIGRALAILIFTYLVASLGFAIIGPAATQAYRAAQKIRCLNSMRSLTIGYHVYIEKHRHTPNKNQWCDLLKVFIDDNDSFLCTKDKIGPCSYAMNENLPTDVYDLPPDLVVLFESAPGWNRVGGADDVVTDRHDKPGANIAFADGRVEFVEAEEIPNLRWTVEDNAERE